MMLDKLADGGVVAFHEENVEEGRRGHKVQHLHLSRMWAL